jgi:hypothetical protein
MANLFDFNGSWNMHADGWIFNLNIQQRDNKITGTMTGINNTQTSTITGNVTGPKIEFTRIGDAAGQQYEGYLFNGWFTPPPPSDTDNNRAVAGIATESDTITFGWYATR